MVLLEFSMSPLGKGESVGKYVDAGYDHLYFHQIGPDQDGFFRFWERELAPKLA